MGHRGAARIAIVALSMVLAGCLGASGTPLPDGAVTVPTYPKGATVCPAGGLVPVTLEGSADDPDHIWAVGIAEHNRIRLVWPLGFYGRLEPELEVIAYDGTVVERGRGTTVSDLGGAGAYPEFDVCIVGSKVYVQR